MIKRRSPWNSRNPITAGDDDFSVVNKRSFVRALAKGRASDGNRDVKRYVAYHIRASSECQDSIRIMRPIVFGPNELMNLSLPAGLFFKPLAIAIMTLFFQGESDPKRWHALVRRLK